MVETTGRSIKQNKYHMRLESLHVLPIKYYYRIEPNHYGYWPSNNGPNR
jgi:hypothetical protein